MARPFRLFSIYDFFSVFLPGLATVMGTALLLPREIDIPLVAALLPLLVLSFIFGQALHSVSAFIEGLLAKSDRINSHREAFSSELESPNKIGQQVVRQFKEEIAVLLRDDDLMDDRVMKREDWGEIYTFVQSYVYSKETGRSRTFQAIFAFSRSMTILFVGLPVIYHTHQYIRENFDLIDRNPNYLLFFDSYGEFTEAIIPLCIIGAVIFFYSTYSYKRYFAQYLISDFVAIRQADR